MFNKSFAFGLVAAGLMILPTAAFASERYEDNEQFQDSEQVTVQEGAAVDGGTNIQRSDTVNVQKIENRRNGGRRGYGHGGYDRGGYGHDGYDRGSYGHNGYRRDRH